jgi:hypothetical protein
MKIIFYLSLIFLTSCLPEKDVKKITAKIAVKNQTVDFGQNLVGEVKTQVVTLNHASGSLTIKNLKVSKFGEGSEFNYYGGEFPGQGGDCGSAIKENKSCKLVLSFSATKAGIWKDTLDIDYNDGVEDQSLKLSLVASSGSLAELEMSADKIDFGIKELNSKSTASVTIKNIGEFDAKNVEAELDGSADIKFKGGSYPGVGGDCGSKIKANDNCKIILEFNPKSNNSFLTTLRINYKNPYEENQNSLSFSGVGASITANLFFSEESFTYNNTTVSAQRTKTFTLENRGILPATNLNFSFSHSVYTLSSTTCGASLAVNAKCDVVVNFTPVSNTTYNGNIVANYHNGKTTTTETLSLTGTGTTVANLAFNLVSPFDFGSQAINRSTSQTIKITNNGESDATNLVINGLAAPFSIESTSCKTQLKPTLSCMVTVSANPNSTLEVIDSLEVSYHNGINNASLSFVLEITGINLAILEFDQYMLNFDAQMVNESSSEVVTLTNVGTAPATFLTPSNLVGAFSVNGASTCTLGLTLNPNDSCSFIIEAQSATSQFYAQFLAVTYFDGASTQTESLDLRVPIYRYATLDIILANPDNLADPDYFFAYTPPSINYFNNILIQIHEEASGLTPTTVVINSVEVNNSNFLKVANAAIPGNNEFNTFMECEGNLLGISDDDNICQTSFAFNQETNGDYSSTITVKFYNDIDRVHEETQTINITGRVADLGYTEIATIYDFEDVAVGGSLEKEIILTNLGTDEISDIELSSLSASNGYFVTGNTCTSNIAPNDSCSIKITFTPTATRYYEREFTIKYDNALFEKTMKTTLIGYGKKVANLKLSKASFDFGPSLINTAKTTTLSLTNIGEVTAKDIDFSHLNVPYRVINNLCGTNLTPNTTCSFDIEYLPRVAGVEDFENLTIDYFNGASAQQLALPIEGLGEVAPATHNGWKEIFASGNKVDVSGNTTIDKKVKLVWEEMTPEVGYTITGYRIYRSLTAGDYVLSNYLAEVDDATFEYIDTDSALMVGTTYYYLVKPVILGTSARTQANYSEVKIILPPDNMVFVHRWMANQYFCEQIGATIDRSNNHRCNFSGIGSKSGKFDLGYHLLVDRFELGANQTAKPGQNPYIGTQVAAWNTCQNSTNDIFLDNNFSTPIKKRLLSRKEFLLASAWPASLDNSDINNLEEGNLGTSNCNGLGTTIESTGNNEDCASRFGAEDMVGNSWEWVSDRVFNGIGVSNSNEKIDVDNNDINGVSVATITTDSFKNYLCYSPAVGLPIAFTNGSCPTATYELASSSIFSPTVDEFFQNDYYYQVGTGLRMAAVGGGYNQYPGRYTLSWLSTISTGARCAAQIP